MERRTATVADVLLAGLMLLMAASVPAQVSTSDPASLLFFPVTNTGERATMQIASSSNSSFYVRCFRIVPPVNAGGACGAEEIFAEVLFAHQPRRVASATIPEIGGLICVLEDDFGVVRIGANVLMGFATRVAPITDDVTSYNAIGLEGDPDAFEEEGTHVLGAPGGIYGACPRTWIANHLADGASDGPEENQATVETRFTVMPCSYDFVAQTSGSVRLRFTVITDLVEEFTFERTVSCWGQIVSSDVPELARAVLGRNVVQTRITSLDGGGVIIVGEETRTSESGQASAMISLQPGPDLAAGDVLVLPVEE